MSDQYTVFGNPIAHSKSPQIHQLFAAQTQQNIQYNASLVEIGEFSNALNQFTAVGGCGCNVTVPFKRDAWQYSTQLSERAKLAQAVNTMYPLENGGYFGDNTDGIGLMNDLKFNHHISIANKRVLLLGAGGAARGVILPLLNENPSALIIANRTAEKALELSKIFGVYGNVAGVGLADLVDAFDIIINATSSGLQNKVPDITTKIIHSESCCYDMVYADKPTAFMQWSNNCGAKLSVDGLGMLVEQAAEAFFIWRGIRPDTKIVIKNIRKK